MKQHIHLLVSDPQNDFCDLPASWLAKDPLSGAPLAPALPVVDAAPLSAISITLDSHHRYDIAQPTFWRTRSLWPLLLGNA